MLKQISNPFGIFLVSFLSTDSFNIFGMSNDNRKIIFKYAKNGNLIFFGRFHTDVFANPKE